MEDGELVVLKDLKKYYPIRGGIVSREIDAVKAVDGVSFSIKKGETLGLVGESGCGKSTLGRVILGLEKPTVGEVYFKGENIFQFDRERLKKLRREVQIIFQDPFSSLNPRKKVSNIIGDPLDIHRVTSSEEEREEKIRELMEVVGLRPEHLNLFPHQFSGGQRQRIGIARALALSPQLIIADEPISSLDVSIQAQIINLLLNLQEEFDLTYVFISHDLRVVEHVSDRVAVMYLGRIVELSDGEVLYGHPIHPYSEALLSSAPIPNPTLKGNKIVLEGDVPSPINPPSGCNFHTRCPLKKDICSKQEPALLPRSSGSLVACHLR
jgi:oligopeptide/dipeptide ABC transporter ATP-binding protein